MRILIAEDDPSIASAIALSLRARAHAVDVVADAPIEDAGIRAEQLEAKVRALRGDAA